MRHLYLIRHGLSEANVDSTANFRKPDHEITLDERGHSQARRSGQALAKYMLGRNPYSNGMPQERVRMLVSPYRRTRETATALMEGMEKAGWAPENVERREIMALREQSFGLFDGLTQAEIAEKYPNEYQHYLKHVNMQSFYFATMPMGESQAQVSDRVQSTFGAILRNMEASNPVIHTIVVSHGVAIKAFLQAWFHQPWEEAEASHIVNNCSITHIAGQRGRWEQSTLFGGFPPAHNYQEMREEGHV